MKTKPWILYLALCVLLTPLAAFAGPADCPIVVPGKSIGPVKIGDSAAAVARLKLPAGLYKIVYVGNNKRVSGLGLDLSRARCLILDGKKLSRLKRSPRAVAQLIGRCGPVQSLKGGNNLHCRDGKILLGWDRGHASLWVVGAAERRASKIVCDAYLGAGDIITRRRAVNRLTLVEGRRYCFRRHVVTTKWTPRNIWDIPARSCGEKKVSGMTVVHCDWWGLRFFFGQTLKKIEAFAPRR